MMIINYSDKPVIKTKNSIFLAGPTPRSKDIPSWRNEALKILKDMQYNKVVYVPELENDNRDFDYMNQVEWEREALYNAGRIIFWVPREVVNMPGFTTNVEFGYWLAKDPNKVYYGRPEDADKIKYLDWLYTKETGRYTTRHLDMLIKLAVNSLEE